jgi:hypothetical protein
MRRANSTGQLGQLPSATKFRFICIAYSTKTISSILLIHTSIFKLHSTNTAVYVQCKTM